MGDIYCGRGLIISLGLLLVVLIAFVNPAVLSSKRETPQLTKHDKLFPDNGHRTKRFIMAFQVTRPPAMFQMSLKRPYIFNMMSNLTRSLFSSNLSELLRRGFGVVTNGSNSTVVEGITSRQEDLELYEK